MKDHENDRADDDVSRTSIRTSAPSTPVARHAGDGIDTRPALYGPLMKAGQHAAVGEHRTRRSQGTVYERSGRWYLKFRVTDPVTRTKARRTEAAEGAL